MHGGVDEDYCSALETFVDALYKCMLLTYLLTQQDLKSMNLSLNEAIDVAQNRPL